MVNVENFSEPRKLGVPQTACIIFRICHPSKLLQDSLTNYHAINDSLVFCSPKKLWDRSCEWSRKHPNTNNIEERSREEVLCLVHLPVHQHEVVKSHCFFMEQRREKSLRSAVFSFGVSQVEVNSGSKWEFRTLKSSRCTPTIKSPFTGGRSDADRPLR